MSKAYLVIGVNLDDLHKKEVKTKSVTRYDEKTGKPYQKSESSESYVFCGKPVKNDDDASTLCSGIGLECVTGGYESDCPSICGITVCGVVDCNNRGKNLELVDPNAVASITQRVTENLQKAGYEGPIKMFLLMRESY